MYDCCRFRAIPTMPTAMAMLQLGARSTCPTMSTTVALVAMLAHLDLIRPPRAVLAPVRFVDISFCRVFLCVLICGKMVVAGGWCAHCLVCL